MKHVDGKHKNVLLGENEEGDNFGMDHRYPYLCKVHKTNLEFMPLFINYHSRLVWRQTGQGDGHGEWYSFDDVIFKANKTFDGVVCV